MFNQSKDIKDKSFTLGVDDALQSENGSRKLSLHKKQSIKIIALAVIIDVIVIALLEALVFTTTESKVRRIILAVLVPFVTLLLSTFAALFLIRNYEPDEALQSSNLKKNEKNKLEAYNSKAYNASNRDLHRNGSKSYKNSSGVGGNFTNTSGLNDIFVEKVKSRPVDDVKQFIEENVASVNTSLHFAAKSSKYKSPLELRLYYGADCTLKDDQGELPLHIAARYCNVDAAASLMLLNHGSDKIINSQNHFGQTALHVAAESGNTEMVGLLHSYGADVDIKDESGCTALIVATKSGYKEVVSFLLSKGADVNVQSKTSYTALSQACLDGRIDIINELLNHKNIDVCIRGIYNTPALFELFYCVEHKNKNERDQFIKQSADILDLFLKKDGSSVEVVRQFLSSDNCSKFLKHRSSMPGCNPVSSDQIKCLLDQLEHNLSSRESSLKSETVDENKASLMHSSGQNNASTKNFGSELSTNDDINGIAQENIKKNRIFL